MLVLLGFFLFLGTKQKYLSRVTQTASFEKQIDTIIEEEHFKGSLLLIENEKPIFSKAYGYADKIEKRENQVEEIYPIASLQKILTGIIILQLIQENKLTANTRLSHFYPKIPRSQQITIRDLLNHTSGIFMEEAEPACLLHGEQAQIDNTINNLTVSVNQDFNYTNGNYTLLAGIISKVTHHSYNVEFKKRIMIPLHLTNTYLWEELPKDHLLPKSYMYANEQDYQPDDFPNTDKLFSSLLGAGNMYMSMNDLWKVLKAITNGKLFNATRYNQLATIEHGGYQAGFFYYDGIKYAKGSLGGYNTVIYGEKDNQNLVIFFGNQPPKNDTEQFAQQLYDLLK